MCLQRGSSIRICIQCNSSFKIKNARLRRRENAGKFCCLKCKSTYAANIAAKKRKKPSFDKICLICNKEYTVRYALRNSKFCSLKCSSIHQKQIFKGVGNPNFNGVETKCKECGSFTRNGYTFCSKKCLHAFNYKHNTSGLGKLIRQCKRYAEWRLKIKERDNNRCVICSSTENLQVDHIIPLSYLIVKHKIKNSHETKQIQDFWDTNNGRLLCFNCHKKTDTYGSKKCKDKVF